MTTQDPRMGPSKDPDEQGRAGGGGYDRPGAYSGGAMPTASPAYGGGRARNGMGVAALVCGIIAVALSFIPGVNFGTWPLGVLAVVFGAVGWYRANQGMATNKGVAIAGLVLGIVSFFTFWLAWAAILGASATPG
ncbi:DUF4190 domain-containing protein [Glycomyces sp. L485]|uniref:DUF4190 domain-containing protein n=1 Tax=Glycomyces sp. L485 TaxID=2909235 RepID=UPI001F4A41B8|nr:DUF4190 domain-containing protein [Glycomyces sp. L485]MCH7229486.1 DUF4190 domain-containing protein [Glycomyces sp. L485]